MSTSIGRNLDLVSRRGPIGRRLQINLTDRQYNLLREESLRTCLPMAELIRRAVDTTYRPNSRLRVTGVEVSIGVSRNPDAASVGRRYRVRR